MRYLSFLAPALLLAGLALAEEPDREALLGNWRLENATKHEAWSLESDGSMLHVVRSDEGKVNLDLKCKPNGDKCPGTDEGKKVYVSMYFNGSALVQIETHDEDVIKRRFELDGQGALKIDQNPLSQPAKRQSLQLVREVKAAAVR